MKGWERALRSSNLVGASFVGPPTDKQSLIEVNKSPRSITISAPLVIGSTFIVFSYPGIDHFFEDSAFWQRLNVASYQLSTSFHKTYDPPLGVSTEVSSKSHFLIIYPRRRLPGDTDSLCITLSRPTMRECVRPERMGEFDRIAPSMFVDPQRPHTKRELGTKRH